VCNGYQGVDIPAHVEIGHYFDLTGVEQFDQVVSNDIRYVFVENTFITKLVYIELQAFKLNAPVIGLVADEDRGEIGKTRFRAKARELGAGKLDRVFAFFGSVREALELRGANEFGSVFFRGLSDRLNRQFFGHEAF